MAGDVRIVIEAHCICGGSIKAKSSPPSAAEAIVAFFHDHHTGDGHAPATAQQARNARRREEHAFHAAVRDTPAEGGTEHG